MKKKISNYSRKALSVFMAVLMVFSMFALAPEMFTKAEAASAGSYDIRITYNQTGSVGSGYGGTIGTEYNDSCGVTVKYKKNNGTGAEDQTYFKCSSSSGTPTATISGFPTLIYLYYDENRMLGTRYAHLTKLEVKGTSQTSWTTLWSGDLQIGSIMNPYAISVDSSGTVKKDYFGTDSDCKANSNSGSWTSKFPYANTMTATLNPTSVTCPKTATASSATSTLSYGATDQYGVTMASSLCTVTYSSNQAANQVNGSNAITMSASGGTGTVSVPFNANVKGDINTQTVSVKCSWSGSSTKTKTVNLTVNDATYTATFTYKKEGLNTAGSTSSTTATAQYGCSPTAPVTPGQYYTTTDHYTFNGWKNDGTFYDSKSLPEMTSDMSFDADYTVEAHKFDTYENVSSTNTHTKTCSCGYSVTEDCNWDNGTMVIAPTCVVEGSTKYTCVNCGNTRTEQDIAKIDHSFTGEIKSNGDGTHSYKCVKGCDKYGPAIACTYTSEVTTQPTCTTAGVTTYTCKDCGYSYTENIPAATGHSYNDGVITKTPNCVDKGVKTFTCSKCGDTYTKEIPIEPGVHKNLVELPAKEATCTETGLTQGWKCEACNTVTVPQKTIAMVAHKTVKTAALEPTCLAPGNYEYYTCSVCNNVFEDKEATKPTTVADRTRAQLSHSYTGAIRNNNDGTHSYKCVNGCNEYGGTVSCKYKSEVTISPTCTTAGVTTYTCEDCGYSYTESLPVATGHSWGAWTYNAAARTHTRKCLNDATHTETNSCSFDSGVVTTEPTCTTDGVKTYTCSVCGGTYTETVPAKKHNWGKWTYDAETKTHTRTCSNDPTHTETKSCTFDDGVITTEPTCTTDGVKTYTCSVCGGTYTETVPAKKHNWGEWTYDADTKTHTRICSNDVTHTETNSCTFDDGVVTTEPTCTTDGVKTFTCSDCGGTYTETLTAIGHAWGKWTYDAETRKHTRTCSNDPTHTETFDCSFDDGVVTTEPTCTTDGVKTFTCSDCGGTYTETVPAIGHAWSEWNYNADTKTHTRTCSNDPTHTETFDCSFDDGVVTTEPTCTTDGVKTFTCSDCGGTYTETVPAIGHAWSEWNYNADTKTHTRTCSNDPTHTETFDCSFDDGVVTTEPTCTTDGVKTFTCSVCHGTYTETIPANGHTMVKTEAKESTCVVNGNNEYYTCTVCNKVYRDIDGVYETTVEFETLPMKEHSYTGAYLFDKETKTHKQLCVNGCDEYGEAVACAFTSEVITEPTCTEKGSRKYVCSLCHGTYTEDISANGHTMVKTEANPSTCVSSGNNEYYTCSVCHKVYKDEEGTTETTVEAETLAKLEHSYTGAYLFDEATKTHKQLCVNGCDKYGEATACSFDSGVVTTEPTCTEAGVKTFTCSVCHGAYTETVPAKGHTMVKTEAKPSTCVVNGNNEYYTCTVCDKVYRDIDGVYLTTVEAETLAKLEHSYTGAYLFDEETKTHKQLCVNGCNEYGEAVDCTFTSEVTKDPSCAEKGERTYTCVFCGGQYKDEIPALGHSMVKTEAVAPTCHFPGNNEYYTCSVCGKVYKDEEGTTETTVEAETLAKLPHDNVLIEKVESTCETEGYEKYECKLCGAITCIHDESPKPDHQFTATDIPATCTTKGGTHFECSVCHMQYDVLDGDYAEHTWAKEWTVDAPATCTQNGSKSISCTVCGAKGNTAVILKLPHSIDMSTPVNAGAGENYTWLTFKCRTCDYSVAQFTILAKDENGNAIPGAKVTITDSKGEVEKSGNADENGYFCTENTVFKSGNYTVTVAMDDNHKTDGVLTVAQDGSVSGSIGHITKSVCGHLCHKNNFIGRLIRSICTFFSAKFNRTIKCCDDMEWYGKYAEGLK